jgi:Uma2 family endonuclease
MSTVDEPRKEAPPEEDPWRYGWRYVKHTLPDGREEFEQVPLKLEDLLHPEVDDFHVHTYGHIRDFVYLFGTLRRALKGRPGVWVFGDMRTDFGVAGVRPLGPDIEVFADVPATWDRGRATFYRAQEEARPVLVIEITSESTRANDFGIKKEFYRQAGVPVYALVDRYDEGEESPTVSALGFRLTPDGYVPRPADPQGRVWLESVGLWLGAENGEAFLYDQAGVRLEAPEDLADAALAALAKAQERADEAQSLMEEEVRARREAESRAEQEARARAEAQARAREEARVRAETEARAREEARARAEAEARAREEARARAEAEAQAREAARVQAEAESRANDLAARLQEMAAELHRLRGQP